MSIFRKKGLLIVTVVYWFLLAYIVAALVWWFIALQRQNRQMTSYRLSELKADTGYAAQVNKIRQYQQRKTVQYIEEGAIFLLVIIIGAAVIYRTVRSQFRVSQQQQNFIMAITHELKTPIAVTKLNLETLQKHKLDDGRRQKLLSTTLEETERLNTLTSNILISFQLEGGRYNITKEELNLSALAEACVQHFRRRFADRTWNGHIEEDVMIEGDHMLLQVLINNLLENAVKYSAKESAIGFRVARQASVIQLTVTDQGSGIPDEEKKRIFNRFYRMGDELTRKTKGTGLGLYLCSKIAHDHRATISVSDNETGGSNFSVWFKT